MCTYLNEIEMHMIALFRSLVSCLAGCFLHRQLSSKGVSYLKQNLISNCFEMDQCCFELLVSVILFGDFCDLKKKKSIMFLLVILVLQLKFALQLKSSGNCQDNISDFICLSKVLYILFCLYLWS